MFVGCDLFVGRTIMCTGRSVDDETKAAIAWIADKIRWRGSLQGRPSWENTDTLEFAPFAIPR